MSVNSGSCLPTHAVAKHDSNATTHAHTLRWFGGFDGFDGFDGLVAIKLRCSKTSAS